MRQVKLFSHNIMAQMEDDINKWIMSSGITRSIIDIKFSNSEHDFACLIVYEDD